MPLSPDLIRQIGEKICRPVGSVTFEYSSAEAFRHDTTVAVVLIDIPAGGHFFRLDRTVERVLRFFHSSPGTGTRSASIPLAALPDFDQAFLAFTWSPEEVKFYCGPRGIESGILVATGVQSPISFRVGLDGSVFQIGGEGTQVIGVRAQSAGQPILAPTARETWTSTLQGIEVLWTGQSDQGFIFEVVQTSATLSMLVTGLENYAKTRLLELEMEGIAGDWSQLFRSFASKAERESKRLEELQREAATAGESVLAAVVNALRINFQNYTDVKRAYRAAYGIRLGEVGLDSQILSELQTLIGYRHRVVHVSPLLGILNQDRVPPGEPVFANRQLADRSVACFNSVVQALHRATLALRPPE